MIKTIVIVAMMGTCTALSGCATIVHGGPRTINVASNPAGAKVTIYDRSDSVVQMNTTPFVARLTAGYGYFKGQEYRLVFEMPGHANTEVHLKSSLSGWYFGNLLFGGLIGMIIVDPITGAMFNLSPDKIDQPLSPTQAKLIRDRKGFLVVLASEISERERTAMVRVN